MAEAFDAQQSSVGLEGDRLETLQVVQPGAATEVVGVVHGRLGAQCTALLEVLSDHLLEEDAPLQGPVEYLRERELRLQDRHSPQHPSHPVPRRERMW